MDKLKQWIALTVVGALVIVAASWFLLVSPKRSEAADLRDQAATEQAAKQTLMSQLSVLKALAKDLPKAQADLAAVAAKVPDNPALPSLIRALTKAADASGVELISMAPGPPTEVKVPVAPAAVPAATAGQPTPAPVAPAAAVSSVATVGAGTLTSIDLNLQVVGRYFAVEQFLNQLESLTRAFKVVGLSLGPGTSPVSGVPAAGAVPETVLATVAGQVYLAVGREAVAPLVVAVPVSPVPSGAAR